MTTIMKKVELLMDSHTLDLALARITHQILERNKDLSKFGVVGMQTRGAYLAKRINQKINEIENSKLVAGVLDATLYRDDYRISLRHPNVMVTDIPFDIHNMNIVLVDDVLYTGRTIRAAMDQLMDFGRPSKVQLAVLIDRGKEHRELPIQADYIGKTVPTKKAEIIKVMLKEYDDEEAVWIYEKP